MASVPGPHRDTPVDQLLDPARQMRWRVPELALLLSDRAVALARSEGDRSGRLQAEVLALFALNRLGRGAAATGRAIAAVREAEAAADSCAPELRVELAWCARTSGSCDVAARVLQPVLERERIDPVLRAHALVAFAAVTTTACARGTCAEALDEAERLYSACELNRDTVRLLRARGRAARAAHHRRFGEFLETAQAAADGLELLRQLGDPVAESGEVHARLVFEQVQALIELGRAHEVAAIAGPVLNRPVRAAAAESVGWLGLAVATREHLPDGDRAQAIRVLNDTAAVAERHRLDGLLAETLNTLSHCLEQGSEHESALHALRGAYAADRRHRSAVHEARIRLLEEFPAVRDDAPRTEPSVDDPGVRQAIPTQPAGGQRRSAEPAQPMRDAAPNPDRAVPNPDRTVPKSAASSGIPAADGADPAGVTPAETATAQTATAESAGGGGLHDIPAEHALRATDDVRDAARRLMETLTGRAEAQQSAQHPQAMPQPREPEDPGDRGARPDPDREHRDSPGFGIEDDLPDYDGWDFHLGPEQGNAAGPAPGVSSIASGPAPAGAVPAELGVEPGRGPERYAIADQGGSIGRSAVDGGSGADADPHDLTAGLPAIGAQPQGSAPRSLDDSVEPDQSDEPELLDLGRDGPDEQQRDASGAHEAALPEDEDGRRSSGRSLAEIQAALQVFEQGGAGRRRARHTEPDTADNHPTPAAEVLAKHHDDWSHPPSADQPSVPAESGMSEQPPDLGAPAADEGAVENRAVEEPSGQNPRVLTHPIPGGVPAGPNRAADEPGSHEPAEERAMEDDPAANERGAANENLAAEEGGAAPAEPVGESGQVGLADLLTEALMAYESGRGGSAQNETGQAGIAQPERALSESSLSESSRSEPAERHAIPRKHESAAQQGSEPNPAPVGRHSRPGTGSSATGGPATSTSGNGTTSSAVGSFGRASRARTGSAEAPGRGAGARHRQAAFESDPPAETSG